MSLLVRSQKGAGGMFGQFVHAQQSLHVRRMAPRRAAIACGCAFLFVSRGIARPLQTLSRQHWIPLDSLEGDQTTSVATSPGGSMVYISGYKRVGQTGADGLPNVAAVLVAYNSSGVQQWSTEYGLSEDDEGNAVAADSTGVYLAGTMSVPLDSTDTDAQEDTDVFVVKYNCSGDLLWEKSWGSLDADKGNGIAVDGESGLVYVVGSTRGSMDTRHLDESEGSTDAEAGVIDNPENSTAVNAGLSDVFLTCLGTTDGEIQWTVQFGSSATDVGNSVAVGPRGGVFVVGQLGDDGDSLLANPRAFLAKYDYLGNEQFTARLNSTSAHYADDLAPSLGSGGEGVVYMTGYTLGDKASVFLARFEGSTGAQTWLSSLGEESGTPHVALSVEVVEGRPPSASLTGDDTVADTSSDAGVPLVEGEEAEPGEDARVVIVGYNTSLPSAEYHSSTGFTAVADTKGNWEWVSTCHRAERQTAIAVGSDDARADGLSLYIVGTVAESEASPGNYLFLDIQSVVREAQPTPPPTPLTSGTPGPTVTVDPIDGASATTGLSQNSSLWLLIIAPIVVVLSCILMMGYVSKQCAIAFGVSRDRPHEPVDVMDFSTHRDRHDAVSSAQFMHGIDRSHSTGSDWRDDAPERPNSGRRKQGDSPRGWPRFVDVIVRDKNSEPSYRKLGRKRRPRGDLAPPSGGPGGEVEMGTTPHRTPFESPQGGNPEGIMGIVEGDGGVSPSRGGRTEEGYG